MKRFPVVLGAFFLLFAVSGMILMRQVSPMCVSIWYKAAT